MEVFGRGPAIRTLMLPSWGEDQRASLPGCIPPDRSAMLQPTRLKEVRLVRPFSARVSRDSNVADFVTGLARQRLEKGEKTRRAEHSDEQ